MLAIVVTTVIGLIFGAVASRSYGIYFLMLTLTFGVIANLLLRPGDEVRRLLADRGHRPAHARLHRRRGQRPPALYYIALVCAVAAYVLIRYVVRTPFGLSFQGIRDEPVRMASLGYAVPLHRTLAFGFAGLFAAVAGVLYAWWAGQIAPDALGLGSTINLLVMAVIGGLARDRGRLARSLRVHRHQQRGRRTGSRRTVSGTSAGRFNTVVGLIFLAIVIVSPDGLMGIWERLWSIARRRDPERPAPTVSHAGSRRLGRHDERRSRQP